MCTLIQFNSSYYYTNAIMPILKQGPMLSHVMQVTFQTLTFAVQKMANAGKPTEQRFNTYIQNINLQKIQNISEKYWILTDLVSLTPSLTAASRAARP